MAQLVTLTSKLAADAAIVLRSTPCRRCGSDEASYLREHTGREAMWEC